MSKVAILGFGVVGSGVFDVLTENADLIADKCGESVSVKYILDIRDFSGTPYADYLTNDFSIIEQDPEVNIVCETIGGTGAAYKFTLAALKAGKHVVTSNKELVATHGTELLKIAAENNVNYFFEASVGGGIPILRPLTQCLAANKITEVYGILNGTTNYILTEMFSNGSDFDSALLQAQKLGYAEANPSADVDGLDACRKICILSNLVRSKSVSPAIVPTEGIRPVSAADVTIAAAGGYAIKLLGRAVFSDDKFTAYVAPHLISRDKLISGISGVMNGVVVRGNAVNEVLFSGPGAGKLPTASAVAADVIDAVQHKSQTKAIGWNADDDTAFFNPDELVTPWYFRTSVSSKFENCTLLGSDGSSYGYISNPMPKKDIIAIIGTADFSALFRVL